MVPDELRLQKGDREIAISLNIHKGWIWDLMKKVQTVSLTNWFLFAILLAVLIWVPRILGELEEISKWTSLTETSVSSIQLETSHIGTDVGRIERKIGQ